MWLCALTAFIDFGSLVCFRQARFAFTVSSSVTDPQVEDVSEDLGNIFPGFHTYVSDTHLS